MFFIPARKMAVYSLLLGLFINKISFCQSWGDDSLSTTALKQLSLEELMNIDITIVSKHTEPWFEAPASVQVISDNEMKRMGTINIPDALRLLPNVRVAQVNSYAWVVTERGFSNIYANKLLVMIDGRSVYTPQYAGVLWDVQNLITRDISRIEAVSGPGGTLWGANAVNGVINIITKNAKETQGLYFSLAGGTLLRNLGELRYGGSIGSDIFYRVYAQRYDYNATLLPNGQKAAEKWGITNSGFRMDWEPSYSNSFSINGNFYSGAEHTIPTKSTMDGQNVLAKWVHTFSDESGLNMQIYFDRTWRRDVPSTFSDQLNTYDIDIQHNFNIGERQGFLWGIGARLMDDKSSHSTVFVGLLPENKTMRLFSGFAQDEITIIKDKLKFTIGSKLEHNVYSGWEVQPSARFSWTPTSRQTIWGAVSRAIRSPSRLDVDYYIPTFPLPLTVQHVAGGPDFVSEKLIAYETGYRVQPADKISISVSLFYNSYDDLYSVEAIPGTVTYVIQNGCEGNTWGTELLCTYQPYDWWFLKGGYNFFRKDIKPKPGHSFNTNSLGNDPENQFLFQSMLKLPGNFDFNIALRFVSTLPDPHVSGFHSFDAGLTWTIGNCELSVNGQNLLNKSHQEFGVQNIPRSAYVKFSFIL